MIAPRFTQFKQGKKNKQWIDQRSAVRTSEPCSIQRMNFCISSGRVGVSSQLIVIYNIKLCGVNYNSVVLLWYCKKLYVVVWQNWFRLHVSLSIITVFALLKPAVSPTTYKYQAAEIPAIFDFNHKCQKLEMTVDCVNGFIYPYRI